MLHSDIVGLVCEYTPYYVLLDWIDPKKLISRSLCMNTNAFDYLLENPNLIIYPNIYKICPESFIKKDMQRLCRNDWFYISSNHLAIDLIEANLDKCNLTVLSRYAFAIDILKKYPNLINFEELCINSKAIDIIKHMIKITPDKVNWGYISANIGAIDIIEKEMETQTSRIKFDWLCVNKNAVHILNKYPDKISWEYLNHNSNCVELFRTKQERINWYHFSQNSDIFRPVFNKKLYKALLDVI